MEIHRQAIGRCCEYFVLNAICIMIISISVRVISKSENILQNNICQVKKQEIVSSAQFLELRNKMAPLSFVVIMGACKNSELLYSGISLFSIINVSCYPKMLYHE